MEIVCLSDTHNLHRHYGRTPWGELPPGECLVHAGDVTTHGTEDEVTQFLSWFRRQPYRYKIWIAGNHDRCLEVTDPPDLTHAGVYYLRDTAVCLEGLMIWGSPWTPPHQDFAFQLRDGEARWAQIPAAVDVLITHGPPQTILDQGHGEEAAGCPILLSHVLHRVCPQVHVFGHLHESYGGLECGSTQFLNAAVHTWLWKADRPRPPHVVSVTPRRIA